MQTAVCTRVPPLVRSVLCVYILLVLVAVSATVKASELVRRVRFCVPKTRATGGGCYIRPAVKKRRSLERNDTNSYCRALQDSTAVDHVLQTRVSNEDVVCTSCSSLA